MSVLVSARGSGVPFIVLVDDWVVVTKLFDVGGVVEDELSIAKSSERTEEPWFGLPREDD